MQRRFLSSAYSSTTELGRRPPIASGDLSDPAVLRRAVEARSFRGEIILFAFDFCSASEAIGLISSLRRASFEHFLPFTDGEATCVSMQRILGVGGGLIGQDATPPPCFWASWPGNHSGWNVWGSKPSCVSAELDGKRFCVLEQLWLSRYHAAALLLGAGVNVLHIDTDAIFLQDPYVALKAPPLSQHALVVLAEKPANGGLWYASARGGAARWVMEEVVRRTVAVLELTPRRGRKSIPPFDQAMLGDVLFTAADGGRMHREGACEHRELQLRPECAGGAPGARLGGGRMTVWRGASEQLTSPYVCVSRACRRRGSDVPRKLVRGRVRLANLTFPAQQQQQRQQQRLPQSVVEAPSWLFPGAWAAQRQGWLARAAPEVALVHLLGVRCRWCLSSEDADHGAKWEWWHLAGLWPDAGYLRAPLIHATLHGAADHAPPPSREAERANGSGWSAATGDIRTIARHCARKGRARLLYVDRPVVVASPRLVAAADAADDGGAAARALVRQLVAVASLIGRLAVLPSFNCSASWVHRAVDGGHVDDLRVVPSSRAGRGGGGGTGCAPCNVQFACRRHVLSEAQFALVQRQHARGGGGGGGDGDGAGAQARRPLTLPMRSDAAGEAVDLIALLQMLELWRAGRRGGGGLGAARVLELQTLGEVRGGWELVDAALLRQSRLAAKVALMHCGVAHGPMRLPKFCPESAEEIQSELHSWRRMAPTRHPSRTHNLSAVAVRLGFRCADLLCSDAACPRHTVELCAGRLDQSAALDSRIQLCERWFGLLPKQLQPLCDALSGRCLPPDEAYPGRTLWPSLACAGQKGQMLCAKPGSSRCERCIL